jgi:hypothetical protein
MENICTSLLQNFNTNSLDKENKITQAAFLSIAKEYKDTKYDNSLFQLIRNHYAIKKNIIHKPITPNIGGPFHLTKHFNQNTKMTLYIFGERHSDKIDCPPNYTLIENYLQQLIENTDVFIDMYFEFPGFTNYYYSRTIMMAPQRMQELFLKFYDCIQTLTRTSKKCQLSRIHYIDTRSTDLQPNTSDLLLFSQIYTKENRKNEYQLYIINNINFIKNIINNIPSESKVKYYNYWIKTFSIEKKIQKEINKSFYKKEITEFILKKIINKLNELEGLFLLRNLKENKDFLSYKFLKDLAIFSSYVGNYVAVYIDAYALARIFRHFKVKNKLSQPSRPSNIVIYAEDRHSQNYRDFIETINFEKIEESNKFYTDLSLPNEGYGRYCTDMKNITQPFFNQ